uniref:Glycine N-methyltransferase n=1 Tax=Oryzias sinensis TaxID=183150 RepID=A0A8C7XFY6_9TELE
EAVSQSVRVGSDAPASLSRGKRYKQLMSRVGGVCSYKTVDSIMLVEEGFNMVSVDASDKMLKYALKARWDRRKESAFDQWVIEEANWLTLQADIHKPADGYDAVICLGNSFAHLPDFKGMMESSSCVLCWKDKFLEMWETSKQMFTD